MRNCQILRPAKQTVQDRGAFPRDSGNLGKELNFQSKLVDQIAKEDRSFEPRLV